MQTLGADWRNAAGKTKDRFPPLGAIKWHRIILDVSIDLLD